GKSITELIAKRDCLKIKIDAYRDLAGNASSLCDRVTRSEIVILSTVDVRALQKQIDAMSRELRCTDNMIQQLNWLTEID
ncbi:MAG TPA: DIP1984 family protein, partial [Clostridia bacterium]|nr:DIP1984 family protein [Clostridia bacterium]